MLLVGQQTGVDPPLYMYKLILQEAWSTQGTSLSYSVFFTQCLEHHGVPIHDNELHTPVGNTINRNTMSRSKGQGRGGNLVQWLARRGMATAAAT